MTFCIMHYDGVHMRGRGESVGPKKRILLFHENRTVVALRLLVTARLRPAMPSVVTNFAAFSPCDDGGW
jgi:hypothetical protein